MILLINNISVQKYNKPDLNILVSNYKVAKNQLVAVDYILHLEYLIQNSEILLNGNF